MKPQLLVLDDYEGELTAATGMAKLKSLANVTVTKGPIDDDSALAQCQFLFALRERTRLDDAFFSRCPNLELLLQSGGHAYHLDRDAATARGVLVAMGRGAKRPMIIIPELTFGLILGLTRRIYGLHTEMSQGEWPERMGGSIPVSYTHLTLPTICSV